MRVLRQGLNPNFIYPEAHCVNVILKFKKILQPNKPDLSCNPTNPKSAL